jgi:small subunit ribosomal protein S20
MPIKKSAKKRLRQNEKRRLRNRSTKSYLKTIEKKVRNAEDKKEVDELLKKAYKAYDKAASKGVIHKNNAARHKSKLAMFVKQKFGDIASAPADVEKAAGDATESKEAAA